MEAGSIRRRSPSRSRFSRQAPLAEGKFQFVLGHYVQQDHLVPLVAEVMQRFDQRFGIVEEIADDNHQSAPGDAFSHFVQ